MTAYKIVIPSLGRAKVLKERTLETIRDISKDKIFIFVIKKEYDEYKSLLSDYNIIIGELGCAEQKRFISNYFEEDERLLFLDDDIKGFYKKYGSITKPIMAQELFNHSFEMLDRYNASMCGIYPAKNPFFMRMKVRKGLSFCIGQFNAVINKRKLFNDFQYRILEDYERSIRYFLDYKLIRLDYITLEADYNKLEGGWQTESEKRHVEKKEAELSRFKQQYDNYCFIKNKKTGKDIVFKSLYSKEPKEVQMLWIDKGKNEIFELALRSWIFHGYKVILYTDLENNNINTTAHSVEKVDYRTILDYDTDEILQFADLFRYKLLYKNGGLWADADCVLVNDYDFSKEEFIISSEHTFKTGAFKSVDDRKPNIGILKFPPKHELMKELITQIETTLVDPSDGNQFMKLFQKKLKLKKYGYLNKFIKEPMRFCPLPWWVAEELYKDIGVYKVKYGVFSPTANMALESATTIHMWNNFSYNKHKIDFNSAHPKSLFGILMKKFPRVI